VRACGKAVLEHPLLKTYHEHYKVWRLDTTNTRYEHWTRTLPNLKTCHEHSMCRRTPFSRRIMSTTRSQDLTPTLHNPRTCHEHFICYYCWSIPSSRLIMSTTRSEDLTSTLHNSKTCHEHFMCYVLKHPLLKTYHEHYTVWRLDTHTWKFQDLSRTLYVLCVKAPPSRRITDTTKETECLIRICATNSRHELSMCWSTPYQDVSRKPQKLNTYHKHAPRTLDTNTSQSLDLSWTLHVLEHPLLESRDSSVMKTTACSVWSLISWFSNLNRWSSSLGLFYHVPLKRD
jgi:hypothetical protein